MTVPGEATTGERQYRAAWTATQEDGTVVTLHTGPISLKFAQAERDQTARLSYISDAWVEVAEWRRRLDSPEPSDAERVEAAHQLALPAEPPVGSWWRGREWTWVRRTDDAQGWAAGDDENAPTSIPFWSFGAALAKDGPFVSIPDPDPAFPGDGAGETR